MPELPELAAMATFLDGKLRGAVITQVQFPNYFSLKTKNPPPEELPGRMVDSVSRRGKFVLLKTVPGPDTPPAASYPAAMFLAFNLAQAGWLHFMEKAVGPVDKPGFIAARLNFARNGQDVSFDLTDAGTWKGLAVFIVSDPADIHGMAELGPEPLAPGFGLEEFSRLFSARQQLKALLKDQKVLAGIGNAYSDEILHAAKLSPFVAASTLDSETIERLFTTMRSLLADAVQEATGKPPEDLKALKKSSMRVHGRTGQACPDCGDTVREVAYASGSLQYCPTCQTGGKSSRSGAAGRPARQSWRSCGSARGASAMMDA
ncbi:DNA-formamidopyrimidine glycosylase family protein [Arthrobacter cavernae]|uniref:Fpg/Nei family DNA glycosylase n=1 Tax=Arthrobacter cavernae TaxID=2817681 RepID=A0A939HES0_9MICC|nr:DNA-formamidopyrimidine glycosylase family protein [Arthrobacter cavernae]MBO1268536.1 Fpg/Nei family DNA glycosylase [Arthrobacter cavernae]